MLLINNKLMFQEGRYKTDFIHMHTDEYFSYSSIDLKVCAELLEWQIRSG